MWTKNSVDAVLKSYIDDKARALHLAIEISELDRQITAAVASLVSDETGPGAQVITGMPHGTKISNPTEEVAIRLADGWEPPEIREAKAELSAKQQEYDALNTRVHYVEAWLTALSDREHWIVLHQYIRRDFWRDVLSDYDKQFGGYSTKETLKRFRENAFRKIYTAAGVKV